MATKQQTLVADDVLAHMAFIKDAFVGPSACAWEGERTFLFDTGLGGQYLVNVDAAEGGTGVNVHPFGPDMPDDARPRDGITCVVICQPFELLTMLSGGAADLPSNNGEALCSFLQSMEFAARYSSFCERRHLSPWDPPRQRRSRHSLSSLGHFASRESKAGTRVRAVRAMSVDSGEKVSAATTRMRSSSITGIQSGAQRLNAWARTQSSAIMRSRANQQVMSVDEAAAALSKCVSGSMREVVVDEVEEALQVAEKAGQGPVALSVARAKLRRVEQLRKEAAAALEAAIAPERSLINLTALDLAIEDAVEAGVDGEKLQQARQLYEEIGAARSVDVC